MEKLPFPYMNGLYIRNAQNKPCVWYIEKVGPTWYIIYYGQVGNKITSSTITTSRFVDDAINSEIKAKRKKGYKYLNELKDNVQLPVEDELINYLNTYLPINRTTSDGTLLPMLAKAYDNENNKIFKNISEYYGQWKINGLRCFITAYKITSIFTEIKLRFQSREGTFWAGLNDLESYLLSIIPTELLENMIENGWALDGEIYLPGHTVNEINHFVKTPNCPEHKLLQFWCYDIAIEDCVQKSRFNIIDKYLGRYCKFIETKNEHLNNEDRLIILPLTMVNNDKTAIERRDTYIDLGFEGLIMRNPASEYQFGSRKQGVMIKYKKSTDGKFKIIDIKSEGIKRPDIPLFVCKNDINDSCFECHVGGSIEYQKEIFKNKDLYLGKYMYVEYGERSGVEQLPFHVKTTYII